MCNIQSVQKNNFEKYGKILEFSEECGEPFEIMITEENNPWRIAVFRYRNKAIGRMECHPMSLESFEPLAGVTVLRWLLLLMKIADFRWKIQISIWKFEFSYCQTEKNSYNG